MITNILNKNKILYRSINQSMIGSRFCSTKSFDLIVIGSGPGGYVAAIKASQLGMKTACIEKSSTLGGTCLNIGCIPSKALLHCSHHYHQIASGKLKNFGINCDNVTFDLSKMMNHKDNCVKTLTGGVSALFKYNKIEHIKGVASFKDANKINVQSIDDGSISTVEGKHVLIATGSEVTPFPGITVDESAIISSTGALNLKTVPKRLVIIGAGVIGLELGSVWRRLGSQVTCIEFLPNIGGGNIDGEVSKSLFNILKKDGINFLLGYKVLSAAKVDDEITITYSNKDNQEQKTMTCDALLVSVGRRPYTQGLGLENIGVKLDDKNRILVNKHFETSVKHVYAIGDCIPGPMLAHKAEEEGVACVEGICGNKHHLNYNSVPNVIYTHPEVAWVGMSEEEAKKASIKYKVGKFALNSNGRSRAVGEMDGFAKIITDAQNDKILGAHFISSCAGEVINLLSMGIEYGASAEDIARVCFAHPTVAECIKEACHSAAFGKPINGI